MSRILTVAACALALASAGCSGASPSSDQSPKAAAPSTPAPSPAVASPTETPADDGATPSESDPSAMDTAVEGADFPVLKFGQGFTDPIGMGQFSTTVPKVTRAVDDEDREGYVVGDEASKFVTFNVSVKNLTGKPISTDGLSAAPTIGDRNTSCVATGQDFGGMVMPGKTKTFTLECGADKQGRLSLTLDSMELGTLAYYSNEE